MPTKSTTTSQQPAKAARKQVAAKKATNAAKKKPAAEPQESLAKRKENAVSLLDEEDGGAKKKVAAKPAAKSTATALPPISSAAKAKQQKAQAAAKPEAPVADDQAEESAAVITDGNVVNLKPPIAVRALADAIDIKPFQLIHDLMEMEIFASINHVIEPDIAAKVCEKHGFVFEKEARKKGEGVHKPEPVVEPPVEVVEPPEEEMRTRAPIVTFMGHVDHGKTSLLDHIRKARVASGEAGGITQHIGAYSVDHDGKSITFLDTPGHAAFTSMRARGANVTDIAVIVVAADDGLMPQTLEALGHAKAAGVKILVAINKMDLPAANPDKVKQQLQEQEFTPEDWGGDIVCCEVSATKGTGMDDLLEMISLEAEMLELKASKKVDPRGTVIEAQVEPGMGPTATIIVQMGKVKVGQAFLCGDYYGKIKSLIDDKGKRIKEAGPATPVKVLGFNGLPNAGDEFVVMSSEKDARTLSDERLQRKRNEELATPQRATLEALLQNAGKGVKKLRLVIKADVQGSVEAIKHSLDKIESDKVELDILFAAVGPVSESDVLLASASDAVIIGFSTKVEGGAVKAAKREGVQIKLFSIIYELLDQVKEAMTGLLDPETREAVIGHAEVRQVFSVSKGNVAGCVVVDGRVTRSARARVKRGKQAVYDGAVATLRRFQDEVKEVRAGLECGIKLGNYNDYQEDDVIEFYTLEKVSQEL